MIEFLKSPVTKFVIAVTLLPALIVVISFVEFVRKNRD